MPLPGLPWSPEFMAAYENAMAGQKVPVGPKRVLPGTMGALALSYFASPAFSMMQATTRRQRRGIIERFCRVHGDKRVALLQREHIVKLIAAQSLNHGPDLANSLRVTLRQLMHHAAELGLRRDDPTRDVRPIKIKSSGYHSWTEAEIEQFESVHVVGTRSRLAFALLLYTGQRRADVVRMGRQHIRSGMLHVKQEKTGARLEIPVAPELRDILDGTPSDHLTFLTQTSGKPLGTEAFSNWFRTVCDAAGLSHCSAHGLRKAAARRLAESGCSVHEIAAITGHASLREVARYTAAADQRRLATAAMAKVKARTASG